MTIIKKLNDKYYKKYNLFNNSFYKFNLINNNILYNFLRINEKLCNKYINQHIQNIDEIILGIVYNKKRVTIKNYIYLTIDKLISKTNKNLLITNTGIIIANYFIENKKKKNLDVCIFPNIQYNNEILKFKYSSELPKYEPIFKKFIGSYYYDEFISLLKQLNSGHTKLEKYNFIATNIDYIYGLGLTASYQSLLKIPDILVSTILSLMLLENNGSLMIILPIINSSVPVVRKIIALLVNSFKKVEIISNDINQNLFIGPTEYYIKCDGFKDNISRNLFNSLTEEAIKAFEYRYELCDVIDYYDQYTKENPGHSLFYNRPEENISKKTLKNMKQSIKSISKIDSSFFKSSKSSKTKSRSISRTKTKKSTSKNQVKPIYYIEDINIPELNEILEDNDIAFKTDLLVNQLEYLFVSYFEMVNNLILTSIDRDKNGNLYVTEEAIKKKDIANLTRIVAMLEHNKLPYNKHALDVILQKRSEIIDTFYSLDNTIKTILINYEDRDTKHLNKTALQNMHLTAPYTFDLFTEYFERINMSYLVKENLLKELELERAPPEVREPMEDFTRGINKYLNRNMPHLTIEISNGFTKLWEILNVFPQLVPSSRTSFKTLHICESPGQMIKCLEYFVEKKRHRIRHYDWRANALNPRSVENIAKYGKKNIFDDRYGFIRNYYNKWLWGADNTGDITKVENVKWFRNYVNLKKGKWIRPDEKLDLIVGDGGLSTFEFPTFLLQKLDLAQAVMVMSCSSIGGNCCIKHFTPYIKRDTGTYNAVGFFISYLYLYYVAFEKVSFFKPYSSNPDSGEFYVVGMGFKGIEDDEVERLLRILNNFKENHAIIEKSKIPETFVMQINGFMNRMSMLNSMSIEKQNLLLTCYKSQLATKPEKDIFGKKALIKKTTGDKSKTKEEYEKVKNVLKCDRFLDKDNLENILNARYKEWIDIYDFE